jgi:hypothetical protein
MRAVTPTLAAAIESAERVVSARLRVDWDDNGYSHFDYSDTFTRTVAAGLGASPAGYTYSHYGAGGAVALADFSVNGTAATFSVPVAVAFRAAIISLAQLNIGPIDIRLDWTSPAAAGGNLEPPCLLTRVQDIDNCYMARALITPAGAVTLTIYRNSTTDPATLAGPITIPGITYDPAVTWTSHVQASGNRISINVYPAGTAEPSGWQLAAFDNTWATGSYGIRAGRAAGNTNTSPVVYTVPGYAVDLSPEDDLSGKLTSLTVTRDLRGQLPDEVLVVEGISAATASGDLTAGDTRDERLNTVRYFSRTNPNSPLYGKPRDSRRADIDAVFLTDVGFESAPRMADAVTRALPVNAGERSASIEIIDGRDRFRLPVTLPSVIADGRWDGTATIPIKPGLEASWVASYVLAKCGYPLSPRPRTECRLFVPMHGSMVPFVQTAFAGSPRAKWEPSTTDTNPTRVQFSSDAPFFLAANPAAGYIKTKTPVNATYLDGWGTNGRAAGIRIELWIKRSGAESAVDACLVEVYNDVIPGQSRVRFYARRDGGLRAEVTNGADVYLVSSTITYTANVWHLVGAHFDDVSGRITFRVDGTSETITHASTAASTPAAAPVLCDVTAYARVAELHVSICAEATSWLPTSHVPGAVVDRLQNRLLSGIYPDKPVEAWAILQALVAAEFGSVRIDYDGQPNVWSANRRNAPDSLNVQRTLTARQHLADLGYDDSRDMIRNLIRVPWVQYTTSGLVPIWSLTELVAINPTETQVYNLKFEKPLAGAITTLLGYAYTAPNGTGTGYAYNDISPNGIRAVVTVTSPTTATLTITNIVGATLWIVDNTGVPYLIVNGTPIVKVDTEPAEVKDAVAIARRGGPGIGEAPLEVDDNVWRQSAPYALGNAWQLLATLRDEQIVFTDIDIPGDPRLEDLDRVRIQDPDNLVLDTPVLIESIRDRFEPGSFRNTLVARPARDQWVLGVSGTPLGSTILGETVAGPGGSALNGTAGDTAGLTDGVSTALGTGGGTAYTPSAADTLSLTDSAAAVLSGGGSSLDEWDDMATTLLVAASDAPADVKTAANYVCDGTADNVEIQAAITAAISSSKRVQLSMGTFQLAAQINLDGVDDVDAEHDIYFRGCGPSNTILVAASGLAAGVVARKVAKVHVSDMRVEVGGATHGFASVATNTAGAGYRSFWLSTWKNLQVVGPFDGSHSGYAFHFDAPFRSTFENLEAVGIGNGVRLYSTANQFNPGDCTFQRCFMDLFGNSRFGYKIESTVTDGNVNQVEMIMVEAIASGTGCTGIYLGGTGPVTHIKFHGVNLEQFDTLVNFNNGFGSTVDMNYVELRNTTGLNAFTFGANSSGNLIDRVGFWYVPVAENMFSKAGGTATFPNKVQDVNIFGDGGVVSNGFGATTGAPANTPGTDTLLRKCVNNSGGTATGQAVTFAPGVTNF